MTGEDMIESDANIKKRFFVGTSVGLQGGTVPDILDVEDKCVVQKHNKVKINTLVVRTNVEDVETCGLLGGAVPTEMDLERGTVPTLRQPTLREFRFEKIEKKEKCKEENEEKTTSWSRKFGEKKTEEVIGRILPITSSRNSQIKKETEKLNRSGTKRSKRQSTIGKPLLKRGGGPGNWTILVKNQKNQKIEK